MQDPQSSPPRDDQSIPEPGPAVTPAADAAAPAASAAPTSAPPVSSAPATGARPLGVTVIAILAAISGVFGILAGLTLLVGGTAVGIAVGSAALGGLASVIGAVTLVMSILMLAFAWGAWGLQPWAWTLGIVLQAIAIVMGLYNLFNGGSGAVISIALAAAITYYLFQPDVRRAFGRE